MKYLKNYRVTIKKKSLAHSQRKNISLLYSNYFFFVFSATPSPPKNIEIVTHCMGHKVNLLWEDGNDGGDTVIGYLVQYNTSDNPNYWNSNYEEIPKSAPEPRTIDLSPWAKYSFRVLSRNSIGYSEPSSPTKTTCSTPPGHPDRNPDKVRTKTEKKYKLIISWEVCILLFLDS